MCPHIVGMRTGVSGVAVHHTAMYLDNAAICVLIILLLLHVSSHYSICVRIPVGGGGSYFRHQCGRSIEN